MISKKDLLKQMDISYGQLYRWKRQELLPKEWFIKMSVATGQETFFDEKLIVPRIKKILELKDKYQFDELKNFFNIDIEKKKFDKNELYKVEDLDSYIITDFVKEKSDLNLVDVIIIYLFSKYKCLNYDEYKDYDFSKLKLDSYFYLLEDDQKKIYMFIGDSNMIIDKKLVVKEKISFENISTTLANILKD